MRPEGFLIGPSTPVTFAPGQATAMVASVLEEDERVVESYSTYFEGLGAEGIIIGAASPIDVRAFGVLATGEIVDLSELMSRESAARYERFGLLSPELWEQAVADETAEVDFTVLLTGPFVEPQLPFDGTDMTVSQSEYRAWVLAHRAEQRAAIDEIKAPIREWLFTNGAVIEAEYPTLPLLRVRAPGGLLLDSWLHSHPAVAKLQEVEETSGELLGYAGHASMSRQGGVPTDNDILQLQGGQCGSGGCVGGFMAVGMWEDEGGSSVPTAIANDNDRYSPIAAVYQITPQTCTTEADCDDDCCGPFQSNQQRCRVAHVAGGTPGQKYCVEEHLSETSASVGMVGGYTYPAGERGGVGFTQGAGTWDVQYYVANHGSIDYTLGLDYLIDGPVTYANRSQTGVGSDEGDLIDWAFRSDLLFTTLAAGNSGDITSCVHVWSGVCVGNYSYNTYNDTSTHVRHSSSSYENADFQGTTLERPHLLGPGSYTVSGGLFLPDIRSSGSGMVDEGLYGIEDVPLSDAPLIGTSLAAPAVLSLAIQAHQYEGWFSNLAHPIMKKAVLLAATVDSNGDGPVNKGTTWTIGSGSTDGEDGAGHVLRTYIKQILDANQYKYKVLTGSDFVSCGFRCNEYVATTVNVPANKALKVALAWNACATARGQPSDLVNNLNLYVVRPAACGGTSISASVKSEIEMVHDNCLVGLGQSGTYTLKIRMPLGGTPLNCGTGTGEPIGLAWSFQ